MTEWAFIEGGQVRLGIEKFDGHGFIGVHFHIAVSRCYWRIATYIFGLAASVRNVGVRQFHRLPSVEILFAFYFSTGSAVDAGR